MIEVCEEYAVEHNLVFSTDPEPTKSKSKCLYFCGRAGKVKYPAELLLDGKKLPWVEHAEHLGHTLHQLTSMDKDCQVARAKFIKNSIDIREELSFAHPHQKMQAVQALCTDAYGSMLWNLGSESAEQFFKSWNTCVKMAYNIPRSTFTYLVEGYFASGMMSLRNQVLSRYAGFYRNLLSSPSREVRALARIVTNDPRSTTFLNLRQLRNVTDMDQAEHYSSARLKAALPVKEVPDKEKWRLGLLTSLLNLRTEYYKKVMDTKTITAMIESLCST